MLHAEKTKTWSPRGFLLLLEYPVMSGNPPKHTHTHTCAGCHFCHRAEVSVCPHISFQCFEKFEFSMTSPDANTSGVYIHPQEKAVSTERRLGLSVHLH